MAVNCLDNWDDDWENNDTPDFYMNIHETIKNRERELKLLEERRLVEEADHALADDLFNNEKEKAVQTNESVSFVPVKIKKEKPKELKILQEKKKHELQEKQKQQSQRQKAKKQENMRHKEIYGHAELDEYDEKYGYIEDQY